MDNVPNGSGDVVYLDQNEEQNVKNELRNTQEEAERQDDDENRRVQNVTEKEEVKMEEE